MAKQIADRLAATRGEARRAHKRRERFSTLGIGLGVLVLGGATVILLVGAVGWLMRTPVNQGTASRGAALYSCETGVQATRVFSGEPVEIVGVSADGVWLIVNDPGGEGPRMFIEPDALTSNELTVGKAKCKALDSADETTPSILAAPTTKGPRGPKTSTTLFGTGGGTGPVGPGPTKPTVTLPGVTIPGLTTTTTSAATTSSSSSTTSTTRPTTTTTTKVTTTTKATTPTTPPPPTTTSTSPPPPPSSSTTYPGSTTTTDPGSSTTMP